MSGYRLTETAEADLDDILEFIAQRDGLDRALHVYEAFAAAFDLLAENPQIGSRKPALTDDPVRWWPVFRFLIVYDSSHDTVDILRVIHGARELERIFARGE